MEAFRRRGLILLAIVAGLACVGCVEAGEIGVRNVSERPVLLLGLPSCSYTRRSGDEPWIQVDPGKDVNHVVIYGSWFGDACMSIASLDYDRTISIPIRRGREYEVTETETALHVEDVGKHHQRWYLNYPGANCSFDSPLLWFYVVIFALGAPVGLFITGRFFYRYYVLKRR
jgi:hypothetical protein